MSMYNEAGVGTSSLFGGWQEKGRVPGLVPSPWLGGGGVGAAVD